MKKKILCALDIGSSRIAAVAACADRCAIRIAAAETLPACGMSRGGVKDLASLADCVQRIVEKVGEGAQTKIRRVIVGVNGDYIKGRSSFSAVALAEQATHHITAADLGHLRRQAWLLGLRSNEFLLHDFPQDYILDDTHSTFNPLGLLARKIQLNSFVLSASYPLLGNITSAVQQAGLEVSSTVFSPIASGLSVLSAEEKRKGVILLDIGACFTCILFFKDGILRDFKMISFGGSDITSDIARSLKLPIELAEEIKKTSLSLSACDSGNDTVVVRRSCAYKTVERSKIYESAKNSLDDLLAQIKEAISASPWTQQMERGIVGTGGTASLEGFLERIESCVGTPVRLGYLKNDTVGVKNKDSALIAAVGLLYYESSVKAYNFSREQAEGPSSYMQRARTFARNLYQEYF